MKIFYTLLIIIFHFTLCSQGPFCDPSSPDKCRFSFCDECHKHCGRCGWALDSGGRCTNPLCNGYGPKQD